MEIDQINRKRLSVLASGQAQVYFESLEGENDKRKCPRLVCASAPQGLNRMGPSTLTSTKKHAT
jgi:hypothetical protein